MKELNYLDAMRITTEKLSDGGVFLSVGGEKNNTMTLGWASIGYMWKRPVFIALVRPQRHTYELLKAAEEFTVSVPTKALLKKELAFAGTKSGRDLDKFDGHGLTAAPAQAVNAPVISECGLHFECKTLLMQPITPDHMDPELTNGIYPAGDFHIIFFGEILRCYSTDED